MSLKTLTKPQFAKFVENLIGQTKVYGIKRKENKFAFGELKTAAELTLDYDVALQSPRAFFQPSKEKLLDFEILPKKIELKSTVDLKSKPFVLLGIHTYDLKALNQMDRIWADGNKDENYLSNRKLATVIAIEPTRASKWSFWTSMDAAIVDKGFDLLLTDIGQSYVIEIGTDKGREILAKFASAATDTTSQEIDLRNKKRAELMNLCSKERAIKVGADKITELVRANYKNAVWEEQAKKCYSCGSCNLVCPTCYCFDVKDDIELDLSHGTRTRNWDGCLLEAFAYVGSGENFREHKADRFRHRILRKTVFVADKIGELACVGCGRCSEACLPNITDPVYVINKIAEGK